MGLDEKDVLEIKQICEKYDLSSSRIHEYEIDYDSPEGFKTLRTFLKIRHNVEDQERIKILLKKARKEDLSNPRLKALEYLINCCS